MGNIHTIQKFRCGVSGCEKVFNSNQKLSRHTTCRHSDAKPFQCSRCAKSFKLAESLTSHAKRVHDCPVKRMKCSTCVATFLTRVELSRHQATHLNKEDRVRFKCTFCPKSYVEKYMMTQHVNLFHSRIELKYQCEIPSCRGKRFGTSRLLKEHVKVVHGEKRIKCYFCPKLFPFAARLVPHMQIHTTEKPFKCAECEVSFATGANLCRHKVIHN